MTNDNTHGGQEPDNNPDDAIADAEAILARAAETLDDEAAEVAGDIALAESKAAEHLADLQRLQAEYINYRKRVERDRELASEQATGKAVEALIGVLDDIAAAREHGDLADGPFAAIAAKLEDALGRLGWSSFGAPGEAFDPALHEALMTQPSADVAEPTVTQVAQAGHRIGDRVLRPARVIVAQPE